MICRLPHVPELGHDGNFPDPLVLLFGGQRGDWQASAARELDRIASAVVRSDSSGETSVILGLLPDMFQAADVIVCWAGNGLDNLFLNEWIYLSFMLCRHRSKIVIGMDREPDHPMNNGLRFLLDQESIQYQHNVESLIAVASERCRELRGINNG